ncbi:SHOCT domain-containing protein [Clostridium sp.]|uniref:SHOCT domain-containing protein n=1 Tax=Clostridium sp. TaxID=1506 RepID=UPI002FC76511
MFGCGIGAGFTGGWSAWMIIPMIFRLLVIVGVIYFGIKLVKSHIKSNNHAVKILDEKYAMGEITEEEYLKRKNIMGK